MSLVNCPECQKEISDTVKKCPQCGYTLKSNNKKIEFNYKNIIENFKTKKSYKIAGTIILILILLLTTIVFISNKESRIAKNVVEYLEDEGYNCNKEKNNNRDNIYICEKTDDDKTHTYTLSWKSSDLFYRLVEDAFNIEYHFEDRYERYFDFTLSRYKSNKHQYIRVNNTIDNELCSFNPTDNKDTFRESGKGIIYTSYDDECDNFLKEFNNMLEIFEDIVEDNKIRTE